MSAFELTIGQFSSAGRKAENEDSWGALVPQEPLLSSKGIAIAVADGASGAEAGKEASEICIRSFVEDYFCTHESWTVETSVGRVLTATNRWLYAQGEARFHSDYGLVSTFSGIILKDGCAHIFHVGDSRIYQVSQGQCLCLTKDHTVRVKKNDEYLKRAMGLESTVEIDTRQRAVTTGDIFVLMTDGVHRHLSETEILAELLRSSENLDKGARALVDLASERGSLDNLTCQIVRIDKAPVPGAEAFQASLSSLPFPPDLEPGQRLDGFRIVRQIHASTRSQVYLARDEDTGKQVALKTPSALHADDPAYIDQFTREDWIARRIKSPHVIATFESTRSRTFLYCALDYVDGKTLRQWMNDQPAPSLEATRDIIDQIAKGLRAFHRMEMIHRDLKPDNIMIDHFGLVRIIDFGSTRVTGLERAGETTEASPPGTIDYTAPEYLAGDQGSNRSDIYSLGVIAYEMLTGKLPYGKGFATMRAVEHAVFIEANEINSELPQWVSAALSKALHTDPVRRYEALSAFTTDLAKPNPKLVLKSAAPLLARNPTAFWRRTSFVLLVINIALAILVLNLLQS